LLCISVFVADGKVFPPTSPCLSPWSGLPDTQVGTFTQELYDEAKKDGWTVVSMKNHWKRIFAFD
jgi:hypothetical protein